jgi:hypothetical protein
VGFERRAWCGVERRAWCVISAEGVVWGGGRGTRTHKPFRATVSSVWSSVLTGSDYSDPIRSVQVSDNATS